MSHWNYRVVHRVHTSLVADYTEHEYGVYEVYYNDNGLVTAVSQELSPCCAEDMDGLKWVMDRFIEAHAKPVLEWDNIPEVDEPFGISHDGE
jgi:hypothetical protein